ncbi:unnamed protein product [Malus baccata var. baccata]
MTELLDLDFQGPAYTWRGLRNGEWVEERLDRGLINGLWQEVWPTTFAEHGPVLGSDHCPIVIMSDSGRPLGSKLFRFMAFWAKEEECKKIVEECWARQWVGPMQVQWVQKLNACRFYLTRWSRNKFKQRGQQIKELTVQLVELQKQWGTNFQAIQDKQKLIDDLQAQEASFWHQRSRVKWLREGDLNTKFFHQSTLQRRRRNMILKLKADDGQWVEHPRRVRQMVEDHFQNLFKSEEPRHWGALLDCVPPGITEEMNRDLIAPVFDEEIKAAVMNMGRLKAPGPDGFQGIFYQSFWEDLNTDVNSLIRTLLHKEVGPNTVNATHVVLIPKVPNPEMISQFRLISLCNYSYKVLSKVLANRLKVVLPNIISSSQNAFVAGRQIHDNIGIAHEMFHFLKGRKAKTKYELGLKIDMQKAYDRVEWDFLDAIMGRMGFCNRWRQLIMGCVSSVQFAILLNGQPGKSFVPSRGLRQGDPLSPFLFLLVGEVFSCLIQKAVHDKLLDGVKLGASGPIISHIFFADDTLLFLKADGKNCQNLVDLINMYCDASGQQVNFQKSSVYFGANIPQRVSAELANILRVKVVNDPGAYLGVPAIWGRSKKRGLAYIKEKIMGKVQGWKHKLLSTAGREVLVKAVVQAIPAYPMCKDRLVWDASKNGQYSVKSGYRWLQLGSLASRDHRLPRTRVIPKKLWNMVWSLPVPAKIRLFFWLSLHRGLATRQNLFRMRVSLSPICPICNCKDETIEHLFLQCLWVTAIWFGGALNYRIYGESISSWADWLLEVLVRFPGCTAKRKWVPIHPIKVLLGVSSAIGFYWEAMGWTGMGVARLSTCSVLVPHWIPSPSSFYKINVDASWSLSTHSGFAGVVIRDANGQFMAAERYAFSSPSVAAAEATALLRGCELGSSLGFQSVILESDSRESIDWLSGAVDIGSWEAYPVLTRVKLVSEAFQFCHWSWVPRTANGAADFLASRGFPEMGSRVWVDRPPSSSYL